MSNIDKQALVIPQRERHDWSQAVMRNCDFCQQWALTVRHSDGGCICASCCDSEYTTALSSALVVALDELEAKDKRIAELEAREVTLPAQKYCPGEYAGSVLWSETAVWNQAISECAKAIRAAGIGKGE